MTATESGKKACTYCGAETAQTVRDLCMACYQRALNHEKRGHGFDPARRRAKKDSLPLLAVCTACGRERRRRVKGLCQTCYVRGLKRKKETGVFDPTPIMPRNVSPMCRLLRLRGEATHEVLSLLRNETPMSYRRFYGIGSVLADQVGVTRERIRQILDLLRRQGMLVYSVRLTDEARKEFDRLMGEESPTPPATE